MSINPEGIYQVGLVNNFRAELEMPIASADTSIHLKIAADDLEDFRKAVAYDPNDPDIIINPAWENNQGMMRRGCPLTITEDNKMEIVYITETISVSDSYITFSVKRGQERTAAESFTAAANVEQRITAGTLRTLLSQLSPGGESPANRYFGYGNFTDNTTIWREDVLVGNGNEHKKSLGSNISVGDSNTQEDTERTLYFGNFNWTVSGGGTIQDGIVIGNYAGLYAPDAGDTNLGPIAIGSHAEAGGASGIALGSQAYNYVDGGFRVTALSYLPKSNLSPLNDNAPAIAYGSAMQATIQADEIDLTSGTASATLELPANTILLIDSLDWITTVSDAPGGAPEIQVGTDATDNDTLLPATALTAVGLHERQTFAPTHSNGVNSVHVSVAVAATGTAQAGKLVVRGYVMEV